MRRARALLMAPILATASCDFAPTTEPQTRFTSILVEWNESLTSSAVVTTDADAVLVNGLILTLTQCHSLRSDVRVSGGDITITITATQRISNCPEAATCAFQFAFLASSIVAGNYRVRVFHTIQGRPAESVSERS